MTQKAHLHILQRSELMSHISFVESPTVAREFRLTKSDKIEPSADLIFTQTYTDTKILDQLETCKSPYVVHLQGDVWYEMKEIYHAESLLRRINQVLIRARLVVCISDFLRKIAERAIPEANITHLPGGFWGLDHTISGIVPQRFITAQKVSQKKPNDKFILMQINFTLPRKFAGIQLFFQSISKIRPELKNWFFTCVGHIGSNESLVRRWAREYCFNFLPQSPNWPSLITTCQLYLHPSLYDTWGRSVAEAMCAGVPVIAFNAGGVREISEKLIVCEPYHEDEICNYLLGFQKSPEKWVGEGKKLRDHAIYLTEVHRGDYLKILNRIL